MLAKLSIDIILLLPRLLFKALGLLPFVSVTFNDYVAKFIGWGCYVCGVPLMSLLFASILGWCTVFAFIGIFKFVKTYVPTS